MDGTDFLLHYGVLGMRWGFRKDGKPGSTHKKKDGKRVRTMYDDDRDLTSFSNDELRTRIDRLNLVKQYISLVEAPQPVSAGKQFLKDKGKRLADRNVDTAIKTGTDAAWKYGMKLIRESMKK